MPSAVGDLAYAEPEPPTPEAGLDPARLQHNLAELAEEDIPTEIAPRPDLPFNASTDEGAEDRKPAAQDDLTRPPRAEPVPAVDDRLAPALVMIGVVGLIVIVIATVSLLTR